MKRAAGRHHSGSECVLPMSNRLIHARPTGHAPPPIFHQGDLPSWTLGVHSSIQVTEVPPTVKGARTVSRVGQVRFLSMEACGDECLSTNQIGWLRGISRNGWLECVAKTRTKALFWGNADNSKATTFCFSTTHANRMFASAPERSTRTPKTDTARHQMEVWICV